MMKNRIFAYLIDLFIVSFISSLIFCLPVFNKESENYLNETTKYSETYQKYINEEVNEDDVLDAQYNMQRAATTLLITKSGITILYFSIIPYFRNYKTIGQKLLKIKVSPYKGKEINAGKFFIRGLIKSNVIFDITTILYLILASKSTYINASAIITYISYAMYLILLESIIFNQEKRGLHDIIANTKISLEK